MDKNYIQIREEDNVIIALSPLKKGETININNDEFTLLEDINLGHKIAIKDIKAGSNIIKIWLSNWESKGRY